MRNFVATLAMFSVLALSNVPAVAQAPALLSFQGSLDFKGMAPDTMLSLTFRLLDDTTASPTIVWSEVQPNVLVENGIFNVILGSVTPLESLEFYRQLWLEIQDNGDGSTFRYPTQLTASPYAMSLVLPQVHNVSAGGTALWINNGDADGIRGESQAQTGHGLGGYGSSFIGENRGVFGFTASSAGTGVYGLANTTFASNLNYGVYGKSNSNTGFGVYGVAPKTGVYGTATLDAVDAYGVYGATTGAGLAVYGLSSGSGRGVYGHNTGTGEAGHFEINNASNGSDALFAYTNGTGRAGRLRIDRVSNSSDGLYASTNGTGRAGYFEISNASSSADALEATTSGSGYGVKADGGSFGVRATASALSGVGVSGEASGTLAIGARGIVSAVTGITFGLLGQSASDDGYGVHATGGFRGVAGFTTDQTGSFSNPSAAVYGKALDGEEYFDAVAGLFEGRVVVQQSLYVQGNSQIDGDLLVDTDLNVNGDSNVSGNKSFRIDHPLDPANKYLYHFSVESNEVLNVYSGNVTTDEQGLATVTLPDYFDTLNKEDFRYQLTVLKTFARAIVAEEIRENRFVIQTDEPNVKVSWQVSGIRNDPHLQKHPPLVETEKPVEERGTFVSDAYLLE